MSDTPWDILAEEFGTMLLGYAKRREFSKAYRIHGSKFDLDKETFTSFLKWMRDRQHSEEAPEQPEQPASDASSDWLHDRPYWFDESRDTYVIHLASRKRPLAMPGETWRALREAYSNWDGVPASINIICRKFGLARQTVVELMRVMGTTHDSAPWSDEYVLDADEDTLIEDLLRRKEERVLVRAERIEWRRVKKDADSFRRLDLLASRLAQRFEQTPQAPAPTLMPLEPSEDPYTAVISPTDFHWGKYAPAYSGDPFNRDIAKERLWATTQELIQRMAARGRPESIHLALGGDGLHIDNQGRTTTRGTLQDCDGTPEELAWTWVMVCKDYVELLRQVAPIKLFVVPGNHDYYTATLLRAALAGWFHTAEDVEVIEAMSSRQYSSYGDNLITFLHGDVGKVKDWPAIIAGEVPEQWGKSSNRFIFTGHLHTERELPTFGDVTVYRMPSLAGTDGWHHRHGYKSRKALVAYIISKKHGVIATEIAPVAPKK
tara:strand:+ start:320 stop:1789 length:1470 start_codon:yes stop_codon:yes gene_type:complete